MVIPEHAQRFIDQLDSVRLAGNGCTALCPGHDDSRNSLSVTIADDGRVLIYCHAGCEAQSVLTAMGLTFLDLTPPRLNGHSKALAKGKPKVAKEPKPAKERPPLGPVVERYDYNDAYGERVYQVQRHNPKEFTQRRPGIKGWIYNLKGVEKVLYRLPELMAADPNEPVMISAGEKDVNNLVKAGFVATTSSGGEAKWLESFTPYLAGRDVVCLPHNDAAGRKWSTNAAAALYGIANSIRLIELDGLEEHGDVSDWLKAGHTADELRALVARASEWVPSTELAIQPAAKPHHLTDLGNARRLVDRHGRDIRYCHKWRSWLVWTGQRWQRDEDGAVMRFAKATALSIYDEMKTAPNREETFVWAKKSEGADRLRAMISLAESEPGISISHEALDTHAWLFNVLNGELDLRTGQLNPHFREHFLTKLAPVAYDPKAKAPTWDAFLNQIMLGRSDLISFLQRVAGCSLTADSSEQILFFFHGDGSNGKSTYVGTLQTLLGDCAHQAKSDLLLAKKNDNEHPTHLASLFGMRLVVTAEVDDGRYLAEGLMKGLTGDPTITARRMREDEWTFKRTFKIYLLANTKPKIKGTDFGVWRRIMLIPFDLILQESEQDKKLPEKLAVELPGILNWCLKGTLDWQTNGLKPPQAVIAASEQYRAEMDTLAQFIADCCVIGDRFTTTASLLYATYTRWCEQNGERHDSQRAFGLRLSSRGFESTRTNSSRNWKGIGPLDDRGEPPPSQTSMSTSDVVTHSDATSTITPQTHLYKGSTESSVTKRHAEPEQTGLPLAPEPSPVAILPETNGHQPTELRKLQDHILAAGRSLNWEPIKLPTGVLADQSAWTTWTNDPRRRMAELTAVQAALTARLATGAKT